MFDLEGMSDRELRDRSEKVVGEELGIIATLATLDFENDFRCLGELLAKASLLGVLQRDASRVVIEYP